MKPLVLGYTMGDKFLNFDTELADAERWRNRAEEMRMIAEAMISEENREIARRLADSYERLAKLAEQRARRTD
jgi:hypothetical protein